VAVLFSVLVKVLQYRREDIIVNIAEGSGIAFIDERKPTSLSGKEKMTP
jgi:hypothetical protein